MKAPDRRSSAIVRAERPSVLVPVVGALGYAGCVVAYLPLLTLLLPLRIEQIAGEERVGVLATAMIAGAIVASIAGVVFGWLSDLTLERGIGRRSWIAAGLAATVGSYAGVAAAPTAALLICAIMAFQVALNLMLAPLVALLAEESPDRQNGLMSGLLAGAQPLGAAVGLILVNYTVPALDFRLALIAIVVGLCLAPLLATSGAAIAAPSEQAASAASADLALVWFSRLLVQVAGNVLFGYLLFFMEQFAAPGARGAVPAQVGALIFLANIIPLPLGVVLGRWSDRSGRRKPFLVGAVLLDAAGLVAMAYATDWRIAAVGFGVYSVGWIVFLTLQVGFVMQLLPNPQRRGRDLGVINLANTAPVLIGPAIAWWLATPQSFSTLLLVLAAVTVAGGAAMLGVTGRE